MKLPVESLCWYHHEGLIILKNYIKEQSLVDLKYSFVNAFERTRCRIPELKHPTFLSDTCNFYLEPEILHIGKVLMGKDCRLLGEKFVIKWPSEKDKKPYIHFWHQDSAYIGAPHKPYLTCLITLDHSSIQNAALSVIPLSAFNPNCILNHTNLGKVDEFQKSDSLGIRYEGEYYPGERNIPKHAVELWPGDVLIFSSMNLHGSGINFTSNIRRSYLVHFSDGPILNAKGDLFWKADKLP